MNPKGRDVADEALITNPTPEKKISAAMCWLAAEGTDEEQTDGMIATEAIRLLKEKRGAPFFIAAGFFRPHTPYVAPKKYFDLYPLDEIKLPFSPEGDRDDIPEAAFAHNCPIPNYGLDDLHLPEGAPSLLRVRFVRGCAGGAPVRVARRSRSGGEYGGGFLERSRLPPRRAWRGLAEALPV